MADESFDLNTETPMVSIGLLCYNDEFYIQTAVSDLLKQDHSNIELIISDDCSSDGSRNILSDLNKKYPSLKVFLQSQNLGMQKNYEFVLKQSQGKYFMWASSDDRWSSDYVSTLVNVLENDDSIVSAACKFNFIDQDDQHVPHRMADSGLRNYESKFAFIRLIKFSIYYFDDFFYGLHRKSALSNVYIPIWRWKNKKIAWNNNYPVQAFLLARGRYKRINEKSMFFKRTHIIGVQRHSISKAKGILASSLVIVRKINVLTETLNLIYKGSNSLLLTLSVAPFYVARCGYDCIKSTVISFGSWAKRNIFRGRK